MACTDFDSESDDEPLNLNLFNRKCFRFLGIPEETENTIKNIVKQLGGSYKSDSKYIFTTSEYYKSLIRNHDVLFDISFIRDCVDANRYLNIEQYRFTPETEKRDFRHFDPIYYRFGLKTEKRDFRYFDPCCNNFHDDESTCFICNPINKRVVDIKQKRKSKSELNTIAPVKKEKDVKKIKSIQKNSKKINYWEPWECRLLLDYIINNNLYFYVKTASLYRRIIAEGFLTHRSPDSMRVYFCKQILTSLDDYNLPKPIKRKFNKVQRAVYPGRTALKNSKGNPVKNNVLKKPRGKNEIKKKLHISNKKS